MEIEGLAVGGATSPSNKQKGHVVFVRSNGTNTVDVRRHLLNRRKVLFSFVNDFRQSLGQAPGTLDIDEALTAVSWQDGDHAQLAAVTAEDLLEEYKQQRITMCKDNPGRTAWNNPAISVLLSCS